jgi:hypothetical protein
MRQGLEPRLGDKIGDTSCMRTISYMINMNYAYKSKYIYIYNYKYVYI